jgi:hypothetical protein
MWKEKRAQRQRAEQELEARKAPASGGRSTLLVRRAARGRRQEAEDGVVLFSLLFL